MCDRQALSLKRRTAHLTDDHHLHQARHTHTVSTAHSTGARTPHPCMHACATSKARRVSSEACPIEIQDVGVAQAALHPGLLLETSCDRCICLHRRLQKLDGHACASPAAQKHLSRHNTLLNASVRQSKHQSRRKSAHKNVCQARHLQRVRETITQLRPMHRVYGISIQASPCLCSGSQRLHLSLHALFPL